MVKYVVALVALGLFFCLETGAKGNRKLSWGFNITCGLLGVVGLIIFNTMDVPVLGYFESAFLLIVFWTAVNVLRLYKESKAVEKGSKQ